MLEYIYKFSVVVLFVVLQFVQPDFAQLVSNRISMKYCTSVPTIIGGLFDSHVLIGQVFTTWPIITKYPPAKTLLGKFNVDFPIQLGVRKIAVKLFKILTIKNPEFGWQPAQLSLSKYKLHFCGGCLLVTENAIRGVFQALLSRLAGRLLVQVNKTNKLPKNISWSRKMRSTNENVLSENVSHAIARPYNFRRAI